MDFLQLQKLLESKLKKIDNELKFIFYPSNNYSDISSNAPIIISKKMKVSIDTSFEMIKNKLLEKSDTELQTFNNEKTSTEHNHRNLYKYIEKAWLQNGFLNINVSDNFIISGLNNVLDDSFLEVEKKGLNVNLEYVSANPTGPLHYGNSRSVYGDSLARVLRFLGYDVLTEYYINDAGAQTITLAHSVFEEYKKISLSNKDELKNYTDLNPNKGLEILYKGQYIIDIAQKIFKNDGDIWLSKDYIEHFKKIAIYDVLQIIKKDLLSVGIEHQSWVTESSVQEKAIEAIEILRSKGLVYEGILDEKKSSKGKEYKQKLQIFASKKLGDDEDRALTKHDGARTYFANDIGYFYDKIQRKFDWLIVILGADHDSYAKRLSYAVKSLEDVKLTIKTCQMVTFKSGEEVIKLSKRSGNALSLRETVNNIGKDIFRFSMLSKNLDSHLSIDIDKIKEFSTNNPFFYIQHAYGRIASSLKNFTYSKENLYKEENNLNDDKDKVNCKTNGTSGSEIIKESILLDELGGEINSIDDFTNSMKQMSKTILEWRRIIESLSRNLEVHRISIYLNKIAENFHVLWTEGKENESSKFLHSNERLKLILCARKIIRKSLDLLGIEAYEEF
ncbi:arginine--tRNA ligase [Candidatus Nesciobacter abundans]|uniref:Arginine--tRNA ligase n=1 Tax=Candidatus Nesciobacter abundans TaxID=2601668 RepID=A0A5C0UH81_9PROT|nr:arginine--tRNA ligase [Candidatus Nesciobacter abundans]QEK39090.1 arginine--tRNA ligase [Candidatus Nesciobacter abundans]